MPRDRGLVSECHRHCLGGPVSPCSTEISYVPVSHASLTERVKIKSVTPSAPCDDHGQFCCRRSRVTTYCHPDLTRSRRWAHGGVDAEIREIGRAETEQITAGLAASNWPPGAAGLPWVESAYPRSHPSAHAGPTRKTHAGEGEVR